MKKNGIDIEKKAYEFSEDAYNGIKELCTPENAEKAKLAAIQANKKLLENGVDLKAISKEIGKSVMEGACLLAAKMFEDAKTIATEALKNPEYRDLAKQTKDAIIEKA